MKKTLLIIFVIIGVLAAAAVGLVLLRGNEDTWLCVDGEWVKHGNPAAFKPTKPCDSQNARLANPASVNCKEKDGELEIKETDLGQIGICVFADGSKCEEWAYFRGECEVGNKIVVYQPNKDQEVTLPLKITGEARGFWFFEASFPIKLLDASNQVIAQTTAQAKTDWMTNDFVLFEAELPGSILSQSGQIPVTLVLEKDNPSGLPENEEKINIPLILNQPQTSSIDVYFGNSQLDPEVMDCTKVFTIKRTIPKTEAIGRAALLELLKGPTEKEKNEGYFTSINPGVEIQSLTIENGTAKVDFNQQLEYAVGGSCRVAAIRAQISQTLKQFPTVNNVIISIDGRTEDILQP